MPPAPDRPSPADRPPSAPATPGPSTASRPPRPERIPAADARRLGVRAGGYLADGEVGDGVDDAGDSLDLVGEFALLVGFELAQRFNRDVELAAGAALVPDAGDHAVHQQDRVVARLAVGQRTFCRFARIEQVARMSTDGVRVEVRQ